jgi:hypothetical protein
MHSLAASPRRNDGHLWMIALALSLLVNLGLVVAFGLAVLESESFRKKTTPTSPPAETVATIFMEQVERVSPAEPAAEPEKRFARTSDDQAAPKVETPDFIGERDTRATSDRAPDATAPALPSQAGVEPKDGQEIETTESNYQDGVLAANSTAPPVPETMPAPPAPAVPSPPRETSAVQPSDTPGPDAERVLPPPRETLLEGPNPVDVQVPRDVGLEDLPKPRPEKRAAADLPPAPKVPEIEIPADTVRPKPASDPAFSGFQRKTAIVGSISRTGRSALNVENTALGRYQATISRAVEQEWQRNCVRHRDFITPGFLTVRFFVETSGKIRSVQFVGDMETGEIQKGFTLNSIRDAEIPAMPRDLRGEYDKEPLELIFRFYF